MAFCSNCGTQIEEQKFCPQCGTPVAAGAAVTPPDSGMSAQPGISINLASALCYLFGLITGVVFLVLPPYNQDARVRFHAFQSIFLNIAVIVIQIGITFLSVMFHAISFSLGLLVSSLHMLVNLGFFIIWLYMMWKAYTGEKVVLPYIGPLAERQAGGPDSSGRTFGNPV